jgi:NADH-quinone oxidoreductase subunit B
MAAVVVQAGLACCAVEATAVDLVERGQALAEINPGYLGHILVVAGTVTAALGPTLQRAYQNLPEPRVVVAFGACAISGGPYWDSYSVLNGASHLIPVDIHVPGCPPSPADLARALQSAAELVAT